MDENTGKLKILLEHWIEHNEGHKKNFVKWAGFAKQNDIEGAAENLEKAAYAVDESTGYLENALKEIVQEIMLFALWKADFFEVAAFQGGTSLRILHGLPRFSEDIEHR